MESLGSTILVALIAGFFAAFLTPFTTSWFQHRKWRKEKRLEYKYQIFCDAINSLAEWVSDATDLELQAQNITHEDMKRKVNMRPKTIKSLEYSRSLVKAFFSKKTSQLYDEVQKTEISLKNIPHIEFEDKREEVIKAMYLELFNLLSISVMLKKLGKYLKGKICKTQA